MSPGMPNRAAGANPINSARANAPLLELGTDLAGRSAVTDTRSAKLAAYPQIMMKPSGTLAGTANGSFAADSAISALYLMSRHNIQLEASSRAAGIPPC